MPPETADNDESLKNILRSSAGEIMRCFLAICAATFSLSSVALAADPTGEWRVANGEAHIRIDNCDGALWGILSWEKEPGGVDSQNPNPAERTRPLLGSHVLLDMRPIKPGRWDGEVYNAENGKTYQSYVSLSSPDVLRIQGCVFGGLFCGGENWTRIKTADIPPPTPRTSGAPARGAKPNLQPAVTACSGVADGSGTTHKGGLK
jgi:uncharacterized protein (DUF2147 family)